MGILNLHLYSCENTWFVTFIILLTSDLRHFLPLLVEIGGPVHQDWRLFHGWVSQGSTLTRFLSLNTVHTFLGKAMHIDIGCANKWLKCFLPGVHTPHANILLSTTDIAPSEIPTNAPIWCDPLISHLDSHKNSPNCLSCLQQRAYFQSNSCSIIGDKFYYHQSDYDTCIFLNWFEWIPTPRTEVSNTHRDRKCLTS